MSTRNEDFMRRYSSAIGITHVLASRTPASEDDTRTMAARLAADHRGMCAATRLQVYAETVREMQENELPEHYREAMMHHLYLMTHTTVKRGHLGYHEALAAMCTIWTQYDAGTVQEFDAMADDALARAVTDHGSTDWTPRNGDEHNRTCTGDHWPPAVVEEMATNVAAIEQGRLGDQR